MIPVPAPRRLRIATRESALALWQAEHIRARLVAQYPGMVVDLLGLTTQGDRILDQPLSSIGGKGLFIKELEVAMDEGRADMAVHSLKDVPMEMPHGFALACITAREDPRDALVSNRYAGSRELPKGAVVGTSSLRREAQLRERYPHLTIEPLRGNVNTRLRKLDEGHYDAIILAAAGLKRLGFGSRIAALLEPDDSLPAPGQGALALECRSDRANIAGRACATRRLRHDARHHRRARVFARAGRQLPHAARRVCGMGRGHAVAARTARQPRRTATSCAGTSKPMSHDAEAAEAAWDANWPTTSWRAAPRASSRPDAASVRCERACAARARPRRSVRWRAWA